MRKLLLASVAVLAFSASAHAANTVTTTQVGLINSSTTVQSGPTLNLASLTQFGWLAAFAVTAVFLWGLLVFVVVPPLQLRVVGAASEAPNLAATLNQGAFNIGNAAGAWIGAAALTAGVTYQNLPLVGAAIALVAVAVAVLSQWLDRRAPIAAACPHCWFWNAAV